MVFLSAAIFIVSAVFVILTMIVNETDRILTNTEFCLILILGVFSLLTLILSLNFRVEFYKKMEDLDAVRRRYREATDLITKAATKLDSDIVNAIIQKVIGDILLPSELDKQAVKLAKEFPDVDLKRK